MRLSGVVVAQDEERDLPRCLRALAFCDEVVVVDGGSQDGTREVARAAGARVFENRWPGYGAQRQHSLALASGDWLLAVDADEVVDDALREAVIAATRAEGGPDGYLVRVDNRLFGRPLRHGGLSRDLHLRLFRRGKAHYEDRLHAGAIVSGPLGTLPGALVHETYRDLADYLEKQNRYTSAVAREKHARGQRFRPLGAAARLPWGFGRRYLLQAGFLDGWPGFAYAAMSAYYDFLKVAKLADLERVAEAGPAKAP
ncbi:MAG: glycosyltransferase family 2 protein [Deltaproteobacteria bacterium]